MTFENSWQGLDALQSRSADDDGDREDGVRADQGEEEEDADSASSCSTSFLHCVDLPDLSPGYIYVHMVVMMRMMRNIQILLNNKYMNHLIKYLLQQLLHHIIFVV